MQASGVDKLGVTLMPQKRRSLIRNSERSRDAALSLPSRTAWEHGQKRCKTYEVLYTAIHYHSSEGMGSRADAVLLPSHTA